LGNSHSEPSGKLVKLHWNKVVKLVRNFLSFHLYRDKNDRDWHTGSAGG